MRVWALVYAKLLITQFVTTVCANTPIILFNYNRVLFRTISDTTQVKRLTSYFFRQWGILHSTRHCPEQNSMDILSRISQMHLSALLNLQKWSN